MTTNSELLLSKWENAKAFLLDGRVCGDFSLGCVNSEAEDDQGLEFHLYGQRGKNGKYYVEREQLDKGTLTSEGVVIDYYGEEVEIVPLSVMS